MPTIGIVIPVYNGERYLGETVESVLAQGFANWELVLVDDGSTDRSGALAETLADRDRRIRVLHKMNGGVATARNAGLHALGGECEFVAFLDQDDLWYPHTLGHLHALLIGDPLASAAHGTYRRIDAAGHLRHLSEREALHMCRWGFEGNRVVRWPSERPTTFEVLVLVNPIITPGLVLIRRSALLSAGDFDQSVAPADDWDLWLRLLEHGYFAYTDTAVLGYRLHGANVSSQPHLVEEAGRAVRWKHIRSPSVSRAQRSLLVRGEIWVHWFVSVLRLIWAREHWGRGEYLPALKGLRHALKHRYSYYLGRLRIWRMGADHRRRQRAVQ